MSEPQLSEILARHASACLGGEASIRDLRRLPGGASRETWSFDAVIDGVVSPMILRRDPGGHDHNSLTEQAGAVGIDRDTECRLLQAACRRGVAAPPVHFALSAAEGGGFVMARLSGETSARKIHRDVAFGEARKRLAADCGRTLASIHAVPLRELPPLPHLGLTAQIALYRNLLDHLDVAQPVFEFALRWLEQNQPPPSRETLVHGDFRLGNLLVGPEGLVAALDWELAHIGDPMEDLGWLCVRSWRFGERAPVGGFGERQALYAAYEAAGGAPIDAARARYWEIFGTMKWGEICLIQTFTHLKGLHRSVELAAIGRRVSETEYDLLRLLEAA